MSNMTCDTCYRTFRTHNPEGRIVSEPGERFYHLVTNDGYQIPLNTVCGREADWFVNASGTYGVELNEDDVHWHTRQGMKPCPTCWSAGWWREGLARRAQAHGARERVA